MSTSKQDIERALMKGADSLRDTIDAANYKDYVLPLMFVKYLSDTYAEKVEELEKEYEGVRLERQKRYLPFTVAKDCSFTSLYEQRYADNIGQLINMAMRQIENDNNQQLAGVLNTTDYNSENALGTREHKNAILRDLLEDLYPLNLRPSQIQVKEGQVPADVIGDAYEYMIGQFASMAGKKAGSFYTPAAVSEIMAQIVDVKPGYARNFLIPHRLAELATEGAIKNWQLGAERRAKRIEAELAEARAMAEKLAGVVLPFTKTVNSDGVVFGSVNKADIYKALNALGHNISKDAIELNMPIKTLGETEVGIYLKPTVTATIKVQINPLTTVEEKIADAKPEEKAEAVAEAK